MKLHLTAAALVAASALALTGCASASGGGSTTPSATESATQTSAPVATSVTVTFPAALANFAQINQNALTTAGVTNITDNADGSVTMTVPPTVAKVLAAKAKTEFDGLVADFKSKTDGTITDVTPNADYSSFVVKTNLTQSDGWSAANLNQLGYLAAEIQAFSGASNPSATATVLMADGSTLTTINYPAALAP